MRLLNPLGLLGLLSLPLIIGLHLHLDRNRRVIVSSMFLWQFLDAKFQGEKPKFVRFSWLLILDLSIALIFTMALTEPQLRMPVLGKAAVQRVILIDDSISQMANDGDPDRFTLAKDLIVSLIEDSSRRDETILITIGGNAEMVGSTSSMSKRALVTRVLDLSPEGYGVDLRAGLSMGQAMASSNLPMEVYVVTDAAYDFIDVSDFPVDLNWVFLGFEENNQAVLTPVVEEAEPGRQFLFARLANYWAQPVDKFVEVRVDGEIFYQETIKLPGKSIIPFELLLSDDYKILEILLVGSDAQSLDDRAVYSQPEDDLVQVALVSEGTGPIVRAVSAIPDAKLTIYRPGDDIPNFLYDLIIFHGETPARLPAGLVVIFDLQKENTFLPLGNETKVDGVPTMEDHPILEGLDISGIRWGGVPSLSEEESIDSRPASPVIPLIYAGDQVILVELNDEDGDKFFLLPGLNEGNFTKSPAFPIFINNLIDYAKKSPIKTSYLLGEVLELPVDFISQDLLLKAPSEENHHELSGTEIRLEEVGVYSLMGTDTYGDRVEWSIGVNGGDLEESNISPRDWRFQSVQGEETGPVERQRIELNLAPWLLILGMILLVIEAWRAWR